MHLPWAAAIALVLVVGPWRATNEAACSCVVGLSNEHHLSTSASVFVGRAGPQRLVPGPNGYTETETSFEVERQWKGEPQSTLNVRTCGGGSTTCGETFQFETGKRYLVFAWGHPLRTSECELTSAIEAAGPLLEWLEQRKR